MKKRCEICGRLYETNLNNGELGYVTVGLPGEIDGETNRLHSNYTTCVDCAKKIKDFVERLLEGDNNKDKETDAPNKTGHWSFLYSPITHTTLIKCLLCGFSVEETGRIYGGYLTECPDCKAKMTETRFCIDD